jgi:acetyl-CoA carboxylase biotin carboxyl carrier protein
MKLTEIQELIRFVSKSGVSEVEIEQKDFKISIKTENKKRQGETIQVAAAPAPHIQASIPAQIAPSMVVSVADAKAEMPAKPAEGDNYITIKAQMIGTFYRKPNPDAKPFVEVGDSIKAGQEICVIEAMKLYNKIESEVSGKIVKVLVEDMSPVEYDQPLFLVDPS